MNDPAAYLGFAYHLGEQYGECDMLLSADDVVQVAMIGLLELWRAKPDAPKWLVLRTMRYAVLHEITKLNRACRAHQNEPLYMAPGQVTKDGPEDLAILQEEEEAIGALLRRLPDHEYQMICLRLMGHHPIPIMRQEGLGIAQAAELYRMARRRLARWLGIPA